MKYNIKIKNLFKILFVTAIIFSIPYNSSMAATECAGNLITAGAQLGICENGGCPDGRTSLITAEECSSNWFDKTCCVVVGSLRDAYHYSDINLARNGVNTNSTSTPAPASTPTQTPTSTSPSPEDNSSSDFCMDASGIEGICEYGDCTTGTTKLNSSDCSGNTFQTTCCGIVGMNDNQTPLPSSEYDCSDLANGEKTPTGICQHGECPAGSVTLPVSECSDNFWDKTCCKFMVSPSATALSGLTANQTNNSASGTTNVNNSSGTVANNSASSGTTPIVALPSQCGTGQSGGDQLLCDTSEASNAKVLAQCKVFYPGASVCNTMQAYLNAMKDDCMEATATGEVSAINCNDISQGNVYGREASKFASYLASKVPSTGGTGTTTGAGGLDFDSIAAMGLPDSPGVKSVLANIVKWMFEILFLITLIAFIISGGQYLLASGSDEMIKTAKKNMTYSVIGIIVALSGFIIVRAIDTALRGTSALF